VPRFKAVYEILLGEKFEKEKTKWEVQFLKDVPKVNKGETPFAVLRFAHLFDGNHFFEEIDNFDVSFRLKLAINLQDIIQLHDIILMCFSPYFSLNLYRMARNNGKHNHCSGYYLAIRIQSNPTKWAMR